MITTFNIASETYTVEIQQERLKMSTAQFHESKAAWGKIIWLNSTLFCDILQALWNEIFLQKSGFGGLAQ